MSDEAGPPWITQRRRRTVNKRRARKEKKTCDRSGTALVAAMRGLLAIYTVAKNRGLSVLIPICTEQI